MSSTALMNQDEGAWGSIVDLEGYAKDGPWTFVTDGAGCFYPRFVHVQSGMVVFLHAVQAAHPIEKAW